MIALLSRVVAGLLLVLVMIVSAVWAFNPERGLLDFRSFVMAARSNDAGLNPYGVYPDLAQATFDNKEVDGVAYSPNLNPPVSLYLLTPLKDADPEVARNILRAASVGAFGLICTLLLQAYPHQRRPLFYIWLASLSAFWYTVSLGQIYVLLFLAALIGLRHLCRNESSLTAGLIMGAVVAIKPNFVLWPLFLLLARHHRGALAALATAAAISAVPLILEGPGIYESWLEASRNYSRTHLPINSSLIGSAARLGVNPAGYAVAAIVCLGCAILVRQRRPGAEAASNLGLTAALLAGPLSWVGYTLFALPTLLQRRWQGWEWTAAFFLATPAWLLADIDSLPVLSTLIKPGTHIWGLIIILALQVRDLIWERSQSQQPAPAVMAAEGLPF